MLGGDRQGLEPSGELTPAADESVTEYVRKHVKEGRLFVGCEGDEPTIAFAAREFAHEAFVYSSDFPHEINIEMCKEEIEELVENEAMPAEHKEAILRGNAERFYGFDRDVSSGARAKQTAGAVGA